MKSIKLTTTYILTQNHTSVNKIKQNKKIATKYPVYKSRDRLNLCCYELL